MEMIQALPTKEYHDLFVKEYYDVYAKYLEITCF